MAERVEQELLVVERENFVKVGTEENQWVILDTEFEKEEIKKNETVVLPKTNEIKARVIEHEDAEEDNSSDESEASLPSPTYVPVSKFLVIPSPVPKTSTRTSPSEKSELVMKSFIHPAKAIIADTVASTAVSKVLGESVSKVEDASKHIDKSVDLSDNSACSDMEDTTSELKFQLRCHFCGAFCTSVIEMRYHVEEKHRVESALINEHYTPCMVTLSEIASRDRGPSITSSIASTANVFSCIFCDKNYKTKQSAKRHIKQTHGFLTVKDDHFTMSGGTIPEDSKSRKSSTMKMKAHGFVPPMKRPAAVAKTSQTFAETAAGEDRVPVEVVGAHVQVQPPLNCQGLHRGQRAAPLQAPALKEQLLPVQAPAITEAQIQVSDIPSSLMGQFQAAVKRKTKGKLKKEKTQKVKSKVSSKVGYYKELENILLDSSKNQKLELWRKRTPVPPSQPNQSEASHNPPIPPHVGQGLSLTDVDVPSNTAARHHPPIPPVSHSLCLSEQDPTPNAAIHNNPPITAGIPNPPISAVSEGVSLSVRDLPDTASAARRLEFLSKQKYAVMVNNNGNSEDIMMEEMGCGDINKEIQLAKQPPITPASKRGRRPKVSSKGRLKCGIASCLPCSINSDCGKCTQCLNRKVLK